MSNIETSLHQQKMTTSVTTDNVFEPTLVVIESLKQLWSDEIVLKPLIPKFLKLTIQIFRRFIHFCTEDDPFAYENPKMFLVSSLEKQFNLKYFITPIGTESGIDEELKKYLDPLEDGDAITSQIMNQLRFECEESLKKSRGNLIPGIEKLYDRLLLTREDVNNLQLDTLKLLKQELKDDDNVHDTDDIVNTILQQILLKFNRTIFKLIDEKRLLNRGENKILSKMKEIEIEAKELGNFNLENEEFWLEIKAAL